MGTRSMATLAHANEVRLVGRLAGEVRQRELPSGDLLVTFRLCVLRAARARRAGTSGPTVDALDCAAWRADVRRSVLRLGAGDVVEVHGSLRRRFWRAPTGVASRSEVEVQRIKRLARVS